MNNAQLKYYGIFVAHYALANFRAWEYINTFDLPEHEKRKMLKYYHDVIRLIDKLMEVQAETITNGEN